MFTIAGADIIRPLLFGGADATMMVSKERTQRVRRMKRSAKVLFLLTVMIALCMCVGCQKQAQEGKKDITLTITYKDSKSETLELSTNKNYLAEAMVEAGLIEYAEDGYYTTINGVTADYNVDKGWWCLTKDGVMTTQGLNTQIIADGDAFELTYTVS